MVLLVALIILALIFGIGGLIQGLFWLVAVGLILLLVGIAFGVSRLRTSSH